MKKSSIPTTLNALIKQRGHLKDVKAMMTLA